jgi:hypothetical protein
MNLSGHGQKRRVLAANRGQNQLHHPVKALQGFVMGDMLLGL